LDIAERMYGRKPGTWEMGTDASKAKVHNVAKDTEYNFAPELDDNIKHSLKNLADAQKRLGGSEKV